MKRQAPMLALLALIGGLALTTPASASDYSGNCANVSSFNGTGNVSITDTACALPQDITATGSINISATSITGGKALSAGSGDVTVTASGGAATLGQLTSSNGNVNVTATGGNLTVGVVNSYLNTKLSGNKVTASTITSSWGVQVTATSGVLDLANITSNAGSLSYGGNILLSATGNIKAGNLKNNGTSTTGGIEIHANTAGTSTVFNIGGGGTNGTGVLNVSNTTGGGSSPGFMPAGLYVTNGNASSTGGISVSSMSSLLLNSSGGRAGILILDAKSGTLTLPTGTLNADGASGFGAGSIYLLANTLTTANGTIISASQTDAAAATYHYVQIAATTVNVAGASGLQIKADGNGVSQATASAGLIPKNSLTVTSTNDLNSLYWNVVNNAFATTGTITVAGAGPIKISSNGDYSRTMLIGNTITFSNSGTTTVEAKGKTSHEILVSYSGTTPTDLSFTGTGAVLFDSSATTGGSAGDINLYTRNFITNTTASTLNANGPASGNGNAGNIYLGAANTTIGASTKMKFSAVGATAGNGNGGNITVYPGNVAGGTLKLGTGSSNLQVLANAGSTGGNAGTIVINPSSPDGNISIETANAVSAAASTGASANSKGGNITLIGSPNLSVVSSLSGAAIIVDGKGTGDAGTIKILGNGTLKLGNIAGALTLSAKALDTGNGGSIEIAYSTNLSILGTLSVEGGAGTGSNGKGGSINIHDVASLSAPNVTFIADGHGTGLPGTIRLFQTGFGSIMDLTDVRLSASADPAGNASGHDIDISSPPGINMAGAVLKANASNSGNAFGGSVHITSAAQVDLASPNTSITAKGADNGPGGNVVISRTSPFDVNEIIDVSSGTAVSNTSTFGGSITLNSVTCQRTLTGYSWPKAYWNCSNPTAPSTKDGIPAQVASTSPNNSTLATLDTILYVMNDQSQFASYFSTTLSNSTLGFTFVFSGGNNRPVYTAMFENGTIPALGYTAMSDAWLIEATTHELGHSLDISANVESAKSTYINGVIDDLDFLNAAGGGHPCSTNGTAPFDGVTDFQTRQPFCNGAVLNNPNGIYTDPQTGQIRGNADIALISSRNLNEGTLLGQLGYVETFAQAYAYQGYAYGGTFPNGYFDPTADGLFKKNFFQCAQARAATLVGKTYTPTYACN